jgi:fluoroacetyl-CoA thioesterase
MTPALAPPSALAMPAAAAVAGAPDAATTGRAKAGAEVPVVPAMPAGLVLRQQRSVEARDLATAWGNDVPVLATPVLVWWAELAAMDALAPHLPAGWMSVGAAHEIGHVGASTAGAEVEVVAELVAVEGRRCRFQVAATDGGRPVLVGHHVRGLVERDRFVARLGLGPRPGAG